MSGVVVVLVDGVGASIVSTMQIENRTVLRMNTSAMPKYCSITPPSNGPAMRVALPVAESRLIAVESESPARPPMNLRRTGMSVVQNKPLRNDVIAM